MGFIMDGLEAEAYDRAYSDRTLVNRIIGYFRPHTRRMLLVVGLVVLGSAAQTLTPIVIARGIGALEGNFSAQLMLGLAGLVLVTGVLAWAFNYLRQLLSSQAVGDVVLALRNDAFHAVTQRDMSFYDQFPSGKIVSRVTSDTQDFSTVVTLTIDLLSQLLLVLVIAVVMLVVNWQLGLLTLAIAPVVVGVALTYRGVARWATRRAQRAIASVNAQIQETVSGIAVAKSFRQEQAIYTDFLETNRTVYQVRLRQGVILGLIFPALNLLAGIGLTVVIYAGGLWVLNGSVSTASWYLFVQALQIFFFPLTSIASFWSQFQQGLSASERVFALIDAEPRVVQTAREPVGQLSGNITFEQMEFSYRPGEPVLRGFDLHIPAGQTLAVVGHTGAGKSSLVKLIARFYEFQDGRLLVDGRDIRTLDLAQYRGQLGLVPQVPFLFSGSVAQNIRYGRPEAGDAEVEQAARRLGDEWIGDLPDGLETDVGERGARLSLGQRQLVALARVLLQNPSIVILDEATASVDPFTEAQIQRGLEVVMRERTSIIIAHRLSTVRSADRIIVMRAGQIIEEGTHAGLMAQDGHYAELYNTYFRHQSLEYIEHVREL